MGERYFLLDEWEGKGKGANMITESELKRRLLILMDIEECNNWPLAINILLYGNTCDGSKLKAKED